MVKLVKIQSKKKDNKITFLNKITNLNKIIKISSAVLQDLFKLSLP